MVYSKSMNNRRTEYQQNILTKYRYFRSMLWGQTWKKFMISSRKNYCQWSTCPTTTLVRMPEPSNNSLVKKHCVLNYFQNTNIIDARTCTYSMSSSVKWHFFGRKLLQRAAAAGGSRPPHAGIAAQVADRPEAEGQRRACWVLPQTQRRLTRMRAPHSNLTSQHYQFDNLISNQAIQRWQLYMYIVVSLNNTGIEPMQTVLAYQWTGHCVECCYEFVHRADFHSCCRDKSVCQ